MAPNNYNFLLVRQYATPAHFPKLRAPKSSEIRKYSTPNIFGATYELSTLGYNHLFMSTNKRKFVSKITFNSNDVDHGVQLLSGKAVLVLEIPQEILIHWHSLKGKASKGDLTECKYVNFVNSIPELPFKVWPKGKPMEKVVGRNKSF